MIIEVEVGIVGIHLRLSIGEVTIFRVFYFPRVVCFLLFSSTTLFLDRFWNLKVPCSTLDTLTYFFFFSILFPILNDRSPRYMRILIPHYSLVGVLHFDPLKCGEADDTDDSQLCDPGSSQDHTTSNCHRLPPAL